MAEPTREALEAALDLLVVGPVGAGDGHTYVARTPTTEEVALALDRFAAARVEAERERIAGWLDCPKDCRYVNASGTCQRTDEICSHHVAESVRAGDQP